MIYSVLKILYGVDLMNELQSEEMVSFGIEAFMISINGLPCKRVPIDYDEFMFRGYSFSQLEGGDFWNISDYEYVYLLSNSKSVS